MPYFRAHTIRRALGWCLALILTCVGPFSRNGTAGDEAATPPVTPFRLGFSSRMFSEVNESDAKASLKAWARIVAKEQGILLDPAPLIIRGAVKLREALQQEEVEAVIVTCDEYLDVSQSVKLAPIFATARETKFHAEYLLLVHAASDLKSLRDLRGRGLLTTDLPEHCLALPWLDTALAREGLPASSRFLQIVRKPKASAIVLPVFFRSADACLVNRYAFETMMELNPQVGRQLRVLARSPQVVVSVACFRASYSFTHKEKLVAAIKHLHESPAGQQILSLFQVSELIELPESELQTSKDLWFEYSNLAGHHVPVQPDARPATGMISPNP